jgi:predicted nuclease of predicted toxin-antitoxin system
MKFLLDQDVYAVTGRFLSKSGHDVVTAGELGLSRAVDVDILEAARTRGRVLITRDRDFGNLVFVKKSGTGVIYLRVNPSTMNAVHGSLAALIAEIDYDNLLKAFTVVEPSGYRIRKL